MGGNSPCASCKLLRRRCVADCIFAPYFPPDEPQRFAIVHRIFGASNELPVHHRANAVASLAYEAEARIKDPVYGCVGAITNLQNQISQLQMQLAVVQAEIVCIQMQQQSSATLPFETEIAEKQSDSFPAGSDYDLLQQYLYFSSSDNVIQDPLGEGESLSI
ncbi:hypothetical protein Nepgr_000035 [Nepenthes gracilis]|uniref:LOB domain-containing protein n=1 Tax=Nepenthes gracilis TaxID=150966 RepID=A0AAD3P2K6_NEPGR|nr:hypothetical protein Nepgr_000035 [Nepenthes gracilis]